MVLIFIFEPLGMSSLYYVYHGNARMVDRQGDGTNAVEASDAWRTVEGHHIRVSSRQWQLYHIDQNESSQCEIRDYECINTRGHRIPHCVSQHLLELLLIVSHLIPRRPGDAGVQSVFQHFADSNGQI